MSRFLFAWELGANFGHVGHIEPLARGLAARGHETALALRELPRIGQLGRRVEARLYQAPFAPRHPNHRLAVPNYGGMLLHCGYEDAGGLATLVAAWRNIFEAFQPDLLIAEHSPTALLAARAAGLPACALGAGHTVLPQGDHTPSVRPWSPAPAEVLAETDRKALATMNHCLRDAGRPPLERICELYDPARDLMQTLPEFDHYPPRAGGHYFGLMPGGISGGWDPDWAEAAPPRVFAYLNGPPGSTRPLLERLALADCRSLAYAPDAEAEGGPRPLGGGLRYATTPLDLDWVTARAELAITHCNVATTSHMLLAGVRTLVHPSQGEQAMLAFRLLERRLIGLVDAKLSLEAGAQAIRNAALDDHLRDAARALRDKYAGYDPKAAVARMTDHLETLAAA